MGKSSASVVVAALLGLLGCGAARSAEVLRSERAGQILVCPATPTALTFGAPVIGRTRSGEGGVASSCLRRASPECSYSFEVTARSDLHATLFSQNFDGALSLYARSPSRELACADDSPLGDTHRARLDLALDPGRYVLHVEGAGERAGDYELFAELEPLPALSEICRAAEPLEEGPFVRGSTRGAASMFEDSCKGRGRGPDQIYRFSLAGARRVRIREQSEFAALLSLRADCAGPELACGYDGPDGRASLSAELAAGSYLVVMDSSVRGDGGDFVLAFESAEPPAPLEHERRCAALPTLREDAVQELDTFYEPATSAGTCGGADTPEVLYMFELREARRVSVFAAEFEFEPVFAVRRACEYAESEVVCAALPRRAVPVLESSEQLAFELDLPAGDYMLAVDGAARGEMGAGSVRLHTAPLLSAKSRAP